MPRVIALSLLAVAIAGTTVDAADLPAHTPLGAVFAEPYAPRVYVERDSSYPTFVFAPQVDIRPIVGGYYGKPFSYYYKPYYGDEAAALTDAYTRLPYACGFYGYC